MASSIPLSKDDQAAVRDVVAAGEYPSGAEYVHELIRRDAKKRAGKNGKTKPAMTEEEYSRKLAKIKGLIQVGLDDIKQGSYTEYTPETLPLLFEKIKRNARKRNREAAR